MWSSVSKTRHGGFKSAQLSRYRQDYSAAKDRNNTGKFREVTLSQIRKFINFCTNFSEDGERVKKGSDGGGSREGEGDREGSLSAASRRSARINGHARPTAINAFDKELKKSHCTWLSKNRDMA